MTPSVPHEDAAAIGQDINAILVKSELEVLVETTELPVPLKSDNAATLRAFRSGLTRALREHAGSLADESALKLAQDLLGEARRAASGVAVELKRSVERWRMRVLGGKTKLSDATLGVEMKPDHDDLVSVVLRWVPWNAAGATAEDGRSEHRVQLYTGHYEKMKQAYEAAGHPTGLLHARMFAVVCRYDGLSEDKSAYQVQASRRPRVSPATPPRSRRDLARASPHPHAPRPGRRRCRAR